MIQNIVSQIKNNTMRKLFITSLSILITGFSFAQAKKDTLKTEEIVVEKPYTPTISDAFKIKSIHIKTNRTFQCTKTTICT